MSQELVLVLVTLQAAATLYMTGVIWFVQLVHYPLFASVGKAAYTSYADRHVRRTSWVVGPPMLLEAAIALALLYSVQPATIPSALPWVNLALLGVIWLATACFSVPCHRRLAMGFCAVVHRRLVLTNWFRTGAWTLRSAVVLVWLVRYTEGITL